MENRIDYICALYCGLGITLLGQPSTDEAGQQKSKDLYWMVDSHDMISYRAQAGGAERVFMGHYNLLRPTDEVYCKVTLPPRPLQGKKTPPPTCTLNYAVPESEVPELLTIVPANRWVQLSSIPKIPKPPQLVKTSRELLEEMAIKTRVAGLSKASGCTGNLPIVAPACLETIDFDDFSIEWADSQGDGIYASVFFDTLDEVRSQSIRLDRVPIEKHRFGDPRIKQFFEDVQKDAASTNVVLRVSRSQAVEATRIVTVPSRIEQKGYHDELTKIDAQHALIRGIARLSCSGSA